ncbi:MAG: carbohydrate ABC transporter permease [Spirochaetales bacterium]|nr:carbohydrate ABC transporter permease [Spirochaetales bacterium]
MYSRARGKKLFLKFLFYIVITTVVVLWAFPILWIILSSLKTDNQIISQNLIFIFKPTIANYYKIFTSHNFNRFLVNSSLVALGTTVIVFLSAFPASYSMSRYKTGGDTMNLGILVTRIAPPAAVLMPFFIIFKYLSLINTLWALILVNISLNLSFALLLLRSFIDEIPVSIEEAAEIEGANLLQRLVLLIFPLARSGIITTSIFTFIFTWNEYLFAMVLCSSQKVKTLPVAAGDFVTAYAIEWGPVFASGTLILLPILVLTFFVQKYIVKGLTIGAVK